MNGTIQVNKGDKANPGSFSANLSSPKPIFWVLLLLVSLVVPLLGVLLAVYLVVRAFKSRNKRLYVMAAAAFSAAIIGIAVIYGIRAMIRDHKLPHYSYSSLDDYKLSSKLKATDISFQKPIQIKEITATAQQGSAIAWLAHVDTKTKPPSGLAYVTVSSVQSALAASSSYLTELAKVNSTYSGKTYDAEISVLKKFINDAAGASYQVTINAPTSYKSQNIKNNAWVFDFSALNQPKTGHKKLTALKGKIVLAIGAHTFYYFADYSVAYNWQPNVNVWQKVLDSIKIDQ